VKLLLSPMEKLRAAGKFFEVNWNKRPLVVSIEVTRLFLERRGDHRLLQVGVPEVDRGIGLDVGQDCSEDLVEEHALILDVDLAVEVALVDRS
jgi:hypothetical protein